MLSQFDRCSMSIDFWFSFSQLFSVRKENPEQTCMYSNSHEREIEIISLLQRTKVNRPTEDWFWTGVACNEKKKKKRKTDFFHTHALFEYARHIIIIYRYVCHESSSKEPRNFQIERKRSIKKKRIHSFFKIYATYWVNVNA